MVYHFIFIFFKECFLICYLIKRALLKASFIHFQDSFFESNAKRSEIKSIIESFWGRRWQIHPDGLKNYLYSFWKQPVSSFFRNNNQKSYWKRS